jgi:hypothetical protein
MGIAKHIFPFAIAAAASTAAATTFTLDTTIGSDNASIAASAEFTWSGNTLNLHLSNTTDSIDKIIQELTGITFVLSGSPSLQSVSGMSEGSTNCVGIAAGQSCAFDSTPVDPFGDPPDLDGHGAPPNGWGFLPNYALFTFAAGDGSFKPYGIINDSIVGSGSSGGLSNPQHNPLLLGPVDFQFVFAPLAMPPMISGVQFYWGTGGDHRSGVLCTEGDCLTSSVAPVPEPQTLALLGVSLLAMALGLRRGRRAPAAGSAG